MATDPLALNYTGREGRGLAQVFRQDKTGEEVRRGLRRDTEMKYREFLQAEKDMKSAMDTSSLLLKGFDKDVRGELQDSKNAIRAEARELFKTNGVNSETLSQINDMKAMLRQQVASSVTQQKLFKSAAGKLTNQRANKYWDIDATMENLKNYADMSIAERANYDKELLVRKEPEDDYNEWDIPKAMFSPNYNVRKSQFDQSNTEFIANTPQGREWYQKGLERGTQFTNLSQAKDFIRRANALHYKVPRGRSGGNSLKVSPYGDLSIYDVAQERVRTNSDNTPAQDYYTLGDRELQRGGITDIIPRTNESYADAEYYDLRGNKSQGQLEDFTAQQYFTDVSTGDEYLMGTRKYVQEKDPTEFTPQEIKYHLSLTKNQDLLAKYSELGEDEMMEKAMVDMEQRLVDKSKKAKTETVFIKMSPTIIGQQKGLRPNLWAAHNEAVKNMQPAEMDIQEFLSGFEEKPKKPEKPKGKSPLDFDLPGTTPKNKKFTPDQAIIDAL